MNQHTMNQLKPIAQFATIKIKIQVPDLEIIYIIFYTRLTIFPNDFQQIFWSPAAERVAPVDVS